VFDACGAHAGASPYTRSCRTTRSSMAMALQFFARGFRYSDRALFPRHSLAEIKRMHGQ